MIFYVRHFFFQSKLGWLFSTVKVLTFGKAQLFNNCEAPLSHLILRLSISFFLNWGASEKWNITTSGVLFKKSTPDVVMLHAGQNVSFTGFLKFLLMKHDRHESCSPGKIIGAQRRCIARNVGEYYVRGLCNSPQV